MIFVHLLFAKKNMVSGNIFQLLVTLVHIRDPYIVRFVKHTYCPPKYPKLTTPEGITREQTAFLMCGWQRWQWDLFVQRLMADQLNRFIGISVSLDTQ